MSSDSESIPRASLHVRTRANDALATDTLAHLCSIPGGAVRVYDLTVAEPDYAALLDAIFAADSVTVW